MRFLTKPYAYSTLICPRYVCAADFFVGKTFVNSQEERGRRKRRFRREAAIPKRF